MPIAATTHFENTPMVEWKAIRCDKGESIDWAYNQTTTYLLDVYMHRKV